MGTALAIRLSQAGYAISEIIARQDRRSLMRARKLARSLETPVTTARTARLNAEVIWFCVPDSEIAKAARDLAHQSWRGKIAFHSSGALASDALGLLLKKGAAVASVHPLMTFARGSVPELGGVSFAIEGHTHATRTAKRIIHDLGGEFFLLRKQHKPAYHAFATMICPLLVSLLAASEKAAALAKISGREARRRMTPIITQTLANCAKLGPPAAFSGPVVRGDVETIRRHLRALNKAPAARLAYAALAAAALEHLPSRNTEQIRDILRKINPEAARRSGKRKRPASRRSTPRS